MTPRTISKVGLAQEQFEAGNQFLCPGFSNKAGTVARINANFTKKLKINNDPDTSARVKEIWVGIGVAGTEVGALKNAKWIEERVINIPSSVFI